uniref:C2 domain-containing protein n=1 Tax=Catharus ustulatus TaxID=91951 RepID=A0A8C3U570_CATUS
MVYIPFDLRTCIKISGLFVALGSFKLIYFKLFQVKLSKSALSVYLASSSELLGMPNSYSGNRKSSFLWPVYSAEVKNVSKADCYVALKLPTASPSVSRTQVVDNSENPEWNETFQYRIHGAVKNILELTLYDKDVLVSDELASVVFDVGGMGLGQPLLSTFRLISEVSPWSAGRAAAHLHTSAKSVEDEDSKELRVQAAEIRNGMKPKASCRSCLQR